MKPITARLLTALGALLVLGALNFSIVGKERIRRDGEIVYLVLEPVDPRSLIQGDYMALRFALVRELERTLEARGRADGANPQARAPVALDARRVASLTGAGAGAGAATLSLRYRLRDGHVWLGTNAFFFEEGSAERFARARYGEFRVDRTSGEAVLVGLRDERLEPL